MDQLNHYRELIKKILTEYYELDLRSPQPNVEVMIALDETHDQYLWFQMSWEGKRRVREVLAHLRIQNGKIWIEEDWTEDGIAADLIRSGVPRSNIVLGFTTLTNDRLQNARSLERFSNGAIVPFLTSRWRSLCKACIAPLLL
jgi:ribosome-interacting GTPase 1